MDDDEEFVREQVRTFREDAEERIKSLAQAVVELKTVGEVSWALLPSGSSCSRPTVSRVPGEPQSKTR